MFFRLPHAFSITISGKHAERYLQARLTQDIKKLAIEETVMAAALSPQGKTEGVFCVKKIKSDTFILLSTGGDLERVRAALLRYKVADQFDVTNATGRGFWYVTQETLLPELEMTLKVPHDSSQGMFIIAHETFTPQNIGTAQEFYQHRFTICLPLFPSEIPEDELFPEKTIAWYVSHVKGCYTGQEVLEKIDSHGHAPYLLQRLIINTTATVLPGQAITDGSKKLGRILSVENISPERYYAFALLRNVPLTNLSFENTASSNTTITLFNS